MPQKIIFNPLKQISKAFTYVLILLLVIIAIYIRVHGAGTYDYNNDEILHLGIAKTESLKQVLQFSLYETHPPVFYILLHYWLKISEQIGFIRSLSLLFGITLIPLYYLIGKELNGKFTGLYAATLITFSHGCIIQSYLVRQYAVFLFFLSGCFYCYLLWCKNRKDSMLLAYLILGSAACLTHFSAIFTLFVIASYQSLYMFKQRAGLYDQTQWVMANIAIALIWGCTTYIWWNTLVLAQQYADLFFPWYIKLSNIRLTFGYILPSFGATYLVALATPVAIIKESQSRDHFVRLTCFALGLGLILVGAGIYPPEGGRHILWILPIIIPASAWIIADACDWLNSRLVKKLLFPWQEIIISLIISALWISYNPRLRFSDRGEYDITLQYSQDFAHYLSTLDHTSIIIAERDEAFRIKNLYPYLGSDAFIGSSMASLAPYQNTTILFNPYYRRMRTGNIFLETIKAAQQHNMFKGINRLVFMVSWPVADLVACPALDKKVIWFSKREVNDTLSAKKALFVLTPVLIVSKKIFFEQVVSSTGKAHNCIKENADFQYVEPSPAHKT